MKRAPGQQRRAPRTRRSNHENRKRYYQKRWRQLRKIVLARDRHTCVRCGKPGNEIDHVKRAEEHEALFYVAHNLQTLCRTCHQKKTNRGE